MADNAQRLRSRDWFDTPELYGWTRRAALQGLGLNQDEYEGRPIIGVCNTWSELTHCNAHLRDLAEAVKRGVRRTGGLPLEFPVISLGEFNMRPTTMLNVVVLPAPLGPRKPTTSPEPTSKETSCRTVRSP